VSFQPVVHYNQDYLLLIGIVAFLTQLQMLHLLRYHKTIAILGATLAHALWDLVSFGLVMGIIFIAFTSAIYLMYNDLAEYATMTTAMGSQVWMSRTKCQTIFEDYKFAVYFYCFAFIFKG